MNGLFFLFFPLRLDGFLTWRYIVCILFFPLFPSESSFHQGCLYSNLDISMYGSLIRSFETHSRHDLSMFWSFTAQSTAIRYSTRSIHLHDHVHPIQYFYGMFIIDIKTHPREFVFCQDLTSRSTRS